MTRHRILIIDNNEDTLYLINRALNNAGYEVETSTTAAGIVEFKHTVPHLFILDHGLPTIDGIAVSKFLRLQEATRQIPIIMISGHQVDTRAKHAGVDVFIKKPFKLDQLLKSISECLRHEPVHTR